VFAVFARESIGRPAAIGAVCPSSRQLAQRIARQVPRGDGVVIELGGGTGAVTQGLLDNGVRPERRIVVERSRHLSRTCGAAFLASVSFTATLRGSDTFSPRPAG
jgi:phospholipid N-methyltransferase